MNQNMFQIGDQNEYEVNILLEYLVGIQYTGLCSYLVHSGQTFDFLKSQEVFKDEQEYPVEYYILTHEGYIHIEFNKLMVEYKDQLDKSDPDTPYGQLRRWWCYNLAVSMSQGM